MRSYKIILLSALALIAGIVISFPEALKGVEDLRVSLFYDPIPVYIFFPADFIASKAFQAGYFPLWDQLRGIGSPHFVTTTSVLTYPFKLPFYFMDGVLAQNIFILFRIFIGGLGAGMFALSLRAKPIGAIIACVAYTFSGYMMEFLPFQQMNIHAFTPWVFWSLTLFHRTRKLRYLLYTVFPHLFMGSGGHPEPIFYTCITSLCYNLGYGLSIRGFRNFSAFLKQDILFFACFYTFMMFGLLSFPAYPFIEYFAFSAHFHTGTVGIFHHDARGLLSFAIPYFNGPITKWLQATTMEILPNIPLPTTYIGGSVFVAFLSAVLSPKKLAFPSLILTIICLVYMGLVFGIPPFGYLGYVPIFHFVFNYRYALPMIALLTSVLAGVAISTTSKAKLASVISVALLVLTVLLAELSLDKNTISIGVLVGVSIFIISGALLHLNNRSKGKNAVFPVLFLLIVFSELLAAKMLRPELFWKDWFNLKKKEHFVEFMTKVPDNFRYLSPHGPGFHPNRGELFGLNDIKDQIPLPIKTYAQLVSAIQGLKGEEATNFWLNKDNLVRIDPTNVDRSLFDLTGLRFILSENFLYDVPLDFAKTYSSLRTLSPEFIATQKGVIGGVNRDALFTHAPAAVTVDIKPGTRLGLFVGMAENSSNSDGAHLSIFEADNGFKGKRIYSRYIPGDQPEWMEAKSGTELTDAKSLMFISTPGADGDITSDFAMWGDVRFMEKHGYNFKLAHESELKIFENPDAFPRAFVMNEKPPETIDPDKVPDPINITKADIDYDFDSSSINTNMDREGYLVVTDAYFPGWAAYEGETEIQISKAFGVFRAVKLPAGEHNIEMVYKPVSFKIALYGVAISYIFIISLIVKVIIKKRS